MSSYLRLKKFMKKKFSQFFLNNNNKLITESIDYQKELVRINSATACQEKGKEKMDDYPPNTCL